MKRWLELRDGIEKTRTERRKDWQNALIVQVRRAAEKGICGKFEPYRVKKTGRTIDLANLQGATIRARKLEVPAIALRDLPAIENAKLVFRVVLQKDEKRIEHYTLSVVGTEKSSGRAWYVRVDLDAGQRGEGPCSHGMLHGHVGVDPADNGGQDVRMPLPWLDPDEAMAWLFATLDRRLEPSSDG